MYLITEVIGMEKKMFQVPFLPAQISFLKHFTTQLHKLLALAERMEGSGVGTNVQRRRARAV